MGPQYGMPNGSSPMIQQETSGLAQTDISRNERRRAMHGGGFVPNHPLANNLHGNPQIPSQIRDNHSGATFPHVAIVPGQVHQNIFPTAAQRNDGLSEGQLQRSRDAKQRHGGGFVPNGHQRGDIQGTPTVLAVPVATNTYPPTSAYGRTQSDYSIGSPYASNATQVNYTSANPYVNYPSLVSNSQGTVSGIAGDPAIRSWNPGPIPQPPQQQNQPTRYISPSPIPAYQPQIQSIQAGSLAPPSQLSFNSSIQPKETALGVIHSVGREGGIADSLHELNNKNRRTYQRGYENIFHQFNSWRAKYPNAYQMPQLSFSSSVQHRHRDIMQRVWNGPEDDRYLSPMDGHVAKLVVQATQDVYDGTRNSTWRRTFVRNISPIYIQVANFPFSSAPTDVKEWTDSDWWTVIAKWLPACGALLCVLLWEPNGANGEVRNRGWYDAFPYKHWGYPTTARNLLEGPPSGTKGTREYDNDLMPNRALGPRYLCFLNNPDDVKLAGITVQKTDKSTAGTQYLFIGYTTEQFNHSSQDDMNTLHQIAERAARQAQVPAYWIACSCMPDQNELEQDVYRISDVMRHANSLVIIIGPWSTSPDMTEKKTQTKEEMLRLWGKRMWTLPEVLLSPKDKKINVYARGEELPWEITKKHFAAIVWDDPLISRQLIDHYEGNLTLSHLELIVIALKCFSTRQTSKYLKGDISYALMGLLRQRPQIDSNDSAFLAFARLSMANDSDLLLERLICTLPKDHNSSWLTMDDAWDANLWDIYPRCQVAGIGPGDTVILDGAYGAAIRWKAFAPVAYLANDSWRRLGARTILHGVFVYFLVGTILVSSAPGIAKVLGAILLILALLVTLASPYLVRVVYSGKLWATQAWFQGFEGYMDLATIESHIFGVYMGHLTWSPCGSSISKHEKNEFGECVGVDPTTNPAVQAMVEQAKNGRYGDLKIFTLVDTYTLTVTMFAAVRPPVAVLLCGHEGGMQRALMCSYDWTTQTLYRETILRMETPVLEKMFRVHRFRFGLQRPVTPVYQSK